MSVTTYAGVVENGQIRLAEDVRLPEHATVYVIVTEPSSPIRIMMFTTMPAWGLSNAAATLVGQNLGAQHPDRAEASVWRIGAYNMVYLLVVSVVFFALPRQLMGIFSTDPAVIRIGARLPGMAAVVITTSASRRCSAMNSSSRRWVSSESCLA